jgi:hypothetical protein
MDGRLLRNGRKARVAAQAEYVARCLANDGRPDFGSLRLPGRENRIELWRSEHLAVREVRSPLAPELTRRLDEWLAYLEFANTTEEWSVRRALENHQPRLLRGDVRARDVADLQEIYHAIAFTDVLALFGRQPDQTEPGRVVRASIAVLQAMPPWAARLPLLIAEMSGAVVLAQLLREGQAVLGEDPELSRAVTDRLGSVLADEIGHVLLLISRCSWLQLRLLPAAVTAVGLSGAFRRVPGPDGSRLGRDMRNWRLSAFPDASLDRAVIPSTFEPARYR